MSAPKAAPLSREQEGRMMIITPERLEQFATLDLSSGSHDSVEDGLCAIEAVAWLANEKHSDHPECVCPVLGAFFRAWNDGLPDDERNTVLRPFLPRLIGTNKGPAIAERR